MNRTNYQFLISIKFSMTEFSNPKSKEYDLEERTAKFSEDINFRNKIYICKKEANETKYWIKILARHHQELKEKIRTFWREAHECHLIFQKITKTLDGRV
ncbi:MAG: hypothetical protein A2981_00765 [Candidatus Nealsonbacteria bacterium RIFCSPLOWO2_01_FULL_38_120]|nr:MAG: hypothetical protein A2981_00765 [Candidatus Nealsonbacteria bacterium RIFCSPLOWO2_01_FULL_38_120]